MDLKKLLPTRRELIRDVSIGVAVAGAAGFGAAKLFPSEATSSGSGSSSGVATDAEIEAITDNGAITLGPLGSRALGASHRLLSGEAVTMEVPSSKEIANSTALIVGSTADGLYGFSATQRGFGLSAHAPGYPLDLNGTATLQGGTLAHYAIRNRQTGSRYVTLWQGEYHDLYTYIPDSLSETISLLSRFNITDAADGMTVLPKKESAHSIQETRLTVEFGDYVAELYEANDESRPSWPGQTGVGGDFYSENGKVVFISDTAAVTISSWTSESVTDSDLQEMLDDLRVSVG